MNKYGNNGENTAKFSEITVIYRSDDKFTDGKANNAETLNYDEIAISAIRAFAKALQDECVIRHRDGELEAVISYAKINEEREKFEKSL